MSGQFRLADADAELVPNTRIIFAFTDGEPGLRFVDQRMFGGLSLSPGGAELPPEIAHIGRDPFDPERLQEDVDRQMKKGSILGVPGKLRYWDLYREKYGALGVAVDDDFEPYYIVDADKKKVVTGLKKKLAGADELYSAPKHPYTGALLSAVPVPDPALAREARRQVLGGDVPSPSNPPPACRFHTRCPKFVEGHCNVEEPLLDVKEGGNVAACHYPLTDEEIARRVPTAAA